MTKNKLSITSKGWLIIGIVLIITGVYLLFIANSLHNESELLLEYSVNEVNYQNINDVANRISVSFLFLAIASLIIIAIGAIMCIEWILFSKFLKSYMKE